MLDPAEFFLVARALANTGLTTSPTDAHLRRAVSTAYYGLFHHVLRAAAERFIGAGNHASAGYAVLYRSFDHGRMRDVCEALQRPTVPAKWVEPFGRSAASLNLREFARAFGVLQGQRHVADYHPSVSFQRFEVNSVIDVALLALISFDRIPVEERSDFLALMMVRLRI